MKNGLLIALLTLTGCASFREAAERHPYVTGFVVTSLAISGAKALHDRRDGTVAHDVTIQPVNCTGGSCK